MPETHQAWLEGMLLDSQLDELSVFWVKSFYGDDNMLPWPMDSVEMLFAAVQSLSDCLAAHALNAMGKTPRDVGYSNWMGDGPLAGWESLPLGYFSIRRGADSLLVTDSVFALSSFPRLVSRKWRTGVPNVS